MVATNLFFGAKFARFQKSVVRELILLLDWSLYNKKNNEVYETKLLEPKLLLCRSIYLKELCNFQQVFDVNKRFILRKDLYIFQVYLVKKSVQISFINYLASNSFKKYKYWVGGIISYGCNS
eukprot:TRINITY_DN21594_c0_g1_i1.p2 TRINITY_DN21594_c0_g1~~TRINITY_DN21594_c0_g1_i1.p2  ORF type:complete len:122 (+),score=1.65 TRINITY_DN21594_c0_g1_i1:140-505(+)